MAQIPIVDENLALQLAQKKLGERPALGSQVALYSATIQMVDGELVWVVPLYHLGLLQMADQPVGYARLHRGFRNQYQRRALCRRLQNQVSPGQLPAV